MIVKTLNEAGKIETCLRSILGSTDPAATEVIVADSLSDDATVEIAKRFPVRVVQLLNKADRGCGSAGQLGFQYARGERILLLDGDMELAPEFLPAAHRALDADPRLAGVGGQIIDRVMTLEFQRRAQTHKKAGNAEPGLKQHLNGGGLFRAEAIRQSGYLTDRNLHACEEIEFGTRLARNGWRFLRLDAIAVYHYGHGTSSFRLLLNRWRTKYVYGQGELLRAGLGTGRSGVAAKQTLLYGMVVIWWLALIALLTGGFSSRWPAACAAAFAVLLLGPLAVQWRRKGSFAMAVYALALINLHAAGLLAGLARNRIDPRTPLASAILHEPGRQSADRNIPKVGLSC
ncbi:MAG TPA: glycosyltransferase [Dongiaceae bacterium]